MPFHKGPAHAKYRTGEQVPHCTGHFSHAPAPQRERERESLFMDSLVGRLVQVGVAYLCPHIPYEIDTTRAVLREPI